MKTLTEDNVREIAKSMTKEEFKEEYFIEDRRNNDCSLRYYIECPSYLRLQTAFETEDGCDGGEFDTCKKCWESALNLLDFKDSNKLNILEASSLKNTEFEVIYSDGTESDVIFNTDNEGSIFANGRYIAECFESLIHAKFIPISKRVSFIEAIESKQYIRVNICHLKGYEAEDIAILNEPKAIDKMFIELVNRISPNALSEVIEKGYWYIHMKH